MYILFLFTCDDQRIPRQTKGVSCQLDDVVALCLGLEYSPGAVVLLLSLIESYIRPGTKIDAVTSAFIMYAIMLAWKTTVKRTEINLHSAYREKQRIAHPPRYDPDSRVV